MKSLFTIIEKLWLNTKLILGFNFGLLIAAIIGYYSLSSLTMFENEMEKLYEMELLGISHIKEANNNLILIGRTLRQMAIAQDDVTRDKARAQLATARNNLSNEMIDPQAPFPSRDNRPLRAVPAQLCPI